MKFKLLTLSALILSINAQAATTPYEIRLSSGGTEVVATPVSDTVLSLADSAIPDASQNEAYSYDFSSLLTITGTEPPLIGAIVWSVTGTLPAGMSFSGSTLSGTPTVVTSDSFTVVATDVNANGQQVYTLNVNGLYLTDIASISGGGYHTCALTTAGGVKCWGENSNGQLGDNTTVSKSTPVAVSGLSSGVSTISTGLYHTCALTTAGAVKCWGRNGFGQLGDEDVGVHKSVPTAVAGLSSGVSHVSLGDYHTCAVTTAGAVKCWGHNAGGQLGDNTYVNKATPTPVSGLSSGIVSVDLGQHHTCALTTGGGLKCWGSNYYGELGDGTGSNRKTPAYVTGMVSGVSSVSLRARHSCAVTTAGAVKCWGKNASGQLGNNSTANKLSPTTVSGMSSGMSAVSAGQKHACGLTTAGGVKCWGYNNSGELGNNTTTNSLVPVDVSGLATGVSAIGIGISHSCALTSGGIKCWGYNGQGQVGDNTTTQRSAPVQVKN